MAALSLASLARGLAPKLLRTRAARRGGGIAAFSGAARPRNTRSGPRLSAARGDEAFEEESVEERRDVLSASIAQELVKEDRKAAALARLRR